MLFEIGDNLMLTGLETAFDNDLVCTLPLFIFVELILQIADLNSQVEDILFAGYRISRFGFSFAGLKNLQFWVFRFKHALSLQI